MLTKLLDNPISAQILQLLTKEQLSIPQITKSLQNIDADLQTVIAVLGELYHYGLVERIESTTVDTIIENKIQLKNDSEPRLNILSTPLGIPLPNYVSLWNKVVKDPEKLSSNELNDWIFSVPYHLKEKLKDLSVEEIRKKILN
jgi:hypothetical protein